MRLERAARVPDAVRGKLIRITGCARMIGAEPADVAFTLNTADAVARVADGLDWREGDEVVLCDLEFPANVYPWAAQAPRGARGRGRRRGSASCCGKV